MDLYVFKLLNSGFDTCTYDKLLLKTCSYFVDKINQTDFYTIRCNKLFIDFLLRKTCDSLYNYKYGINDIVCNNLGKPFFLNKNIFFNISHSKNYGALVVSTNPVGVDIEDGSMNIDSRTVKIVLNDLENNDYKNAKDKAKQIMGLWTAKESFLKGLGIGISVPINTICYTSNKHSIFMENRINERWFVYQKFTEKFILAISSPIYDNICTHNIEDIRSFVSYYN